MKLKPLKTDSKKFVRRMPAQARYALVAVVFFVFGLCSGYIIFSVGSSESSGKKSAEMNDEQQAKTFKQQLNNQHDRLQSRIIADLEAKKIDQAVAEKIINKNKQIKNEIESIDRTTDEAKELLLSKRSELRAWARENSISRIYLLRI